VAVLTVREVEEQDAGDPDQQAGVNPGAADRAADCALQLRAGGRHCVSVLGAGGAADKRHLGDDRRAVRGEDQVVVGIRLALDGDKARLDGEGAGLEGPARVLAARPCRERAQVADRRGMRRSKPQIAPWITRVASCSSPASARARSCAVWPPRGTVTAASAVAATTTPITTSGRRNLAAKDMASAYEADRAALLAGTLEKRLQTS